MKPSVLGGVASLKVAPRAGAWIETGKAGQRPLWPEVAPRAGAWIETTSPGAGGG